MCWKKPGDAVLRGERIGLVRFGSRVDLWVPRGVEILVALGDNVKGGSSVLARWPVRTDIHRVSGHTSVISDESLTPAGKRTS